MEPAVPHPPTFPDDARCLSCGYSLFGLPEPRCPECGREFDPLNPVTFIPPDPWWVRVLKGRVISKGQSPIWWGILLTVVGGLPVPYFFILNYPGIALILVGGPLRAVILMLANLLAKTAAVKLPLPHRNPWLTLFGLLCVYLSMTGQHTKLLVFLHGDSLLAMGRQIHFREPLDGNGTGIRRCGLLWVHYYNTPLRIRMDVSLLPPIASSERKWNTPSDAMESHFNLIEYRQAPQGQEQLRTWIGSIHPSIEFFGRRESELHRGPLPPGYP